MLPEIWSATEIILSFRAIFCPFTSLMTPKIKNWKKYKKLLEILSFYTCVPQMKIVWCMVPEQKTEVFFAILGHFLPFDPPNNPKNQTFGKLKKTPGDIILHLCATNDDHMYGSWARHTIFCHYGPFFALLPHLQPQKTNWVTGNFLFRFGPFLSFYLTIDPKN